MLEPMKTRFLIATALLLFSAVACSKDDDGFDPEGTVTLNMLDAANGRTLLGDMNVWIDNAMNFSCSTSCRLAEIGPIGGLSAIDRPVLANLASQAAVKTGCGYAVYLNRDLMRFPSGTYALQAGATYYRVKVESLIERDDNDGRQTVGACVKYVSATADRGQLPEPGAIIEDIGSDYWLMDFNAGDYDEIVVDEPFEWQPAGEDGKGIYIWRPSTGPYDFQHYGLYMRKGTSWSYIWLKVR